MPETLAARAVIVDPSSIFWEGAHACLSKGEHVTFASVQSLAEAVERLGPLTPDLALVGPNFPERESLALCREVIVRWPGLKIVLFSRHADDPLFQADAAHAGANACLPREAGEAETLQAIASVMAGHQSFSREILSQAFRPIVLTPREGEVLKLLAEEKTDREIAARLGLCLTTIRNYSQRILEKFGVHSRHEAVRRARRLGWPF